MNKAVHALTSKLTLGEVKFRTFEDSSHGLVEILARVYEKARNALEYRADNLVRRAAIERILKRIVMLSKNPESITNELLTELTWAKYLSHEELKSVDKETLGKSIKKYIGYLGHSVPKDWIIKIASSEIEELFNLNPDYKQFTFFAFQILKQKIKITDENLELIIYFAVDKVYAGSDDEQIAYHILKLAGENVTQEKLDEAWKLFNLAKNHKFLTKISKFVRRQMPPLVLLRDIYFYTPSEFKQIVDNHDKFLTVSADALELQLEQMSGRISTAGVRSVIYVFLTKMILAFGLEVPFEIFFYGRVGFLPLSLNLIFPPVLMWLTTMQIHIPSKKERSALIDRTWFILQNYELLREEEGNLRDMLTEQKHGLGYWIFLVLYWTFFVGMFVFIFLTLGKIGYTFFSKVIFIFFLTIIAFLAYRITQVAKIYSWRGTKAEGSTLMDIISLPILAIGSRLSRGLAKLNFLAFAFDFILEAPFKIILGFVDDWVQFLSIRKEEDIRE